MLILTLSACNLPSSSTGSDEQRQNESVVTEETLSETANSSQEDQKEVMTSQTGKDESKNKSQPATSVFVGSSTTASKKATSSKKNNTAAATSSKQTVLTPTVQQETIAKPETVVDAKPVEKPDEIESMVQGLIPIQPTEFYGRSVLAKRSNATALLAAYDRIVAGVEQMESEISLKDPKHPITVDDLLDVIVCYVNDYPHHFWVGKGISYSYLGSMVYTYTPEYTISKSQLAAAKSAFDLAVKRMFKGIDGSMSQYERELLLHDRLAACATYKYTDNPYTAYAALVEGEAVCEGYARAFQYLCYQAGIPCTVVTGTSVNPATGKPEGHAWNLSQIDGKYYHVDVTWDDQDSALFYAYFNLTDKMIKEDHAIDTSTYSFPSCTATEANYFVKNGGMLSTPYSVDEVAQLLDAGEGRARVYVNTVSEFWQWIEDNADPLAKKLKIKGGYSYGYSALGHEMILLFK